MIPALFDQISQSSNKVWFCYNLNSGKFDYLSQALSAIWQMEREIVLENPEKLADFIFNDDLDAVALRFDKICKGTPSEIEFSLQLPDKTEKQVRVDAYPLKDEFGTITAVAGFAEDITERVQYLDYLLEFGRKKNNVLQIVAHDLQGPLAIVKSVTALLDMDHAEHNYTELSNYITIIKKAYDDCNKLIKEVLLDEHLQSTSTPVKKQRFDAVEKIRQCVDTYVQSKMIKCHMQVTSPEDKIMVELDEIKFTQVINNLITNSIKFTPSEGEIIITVIQEGASILVKHTDTGIGIPEDLQPHLFERNNKTARRGLNGEEPNGVGLSIVKELVEIQGGKISFESEENKGTTFYVTLPVRN